MADHKSWKCLMRSLYSGPGGWTPQAPSVVDTSCHLPLDMQNKQAQAGRAALLDLTFSITLLAHPGPLGREDRTLPSFRAAPDPQGSAKRGPTSRGFKQLFTDTGGCGRVGRGKSNNSLKEEAACHGGLGETQNLDWCCSPEMPASPFSGFVFSSVK